MIHICKKDSHSRINYSCFHYNENYFITPKVKKKTLEFMEFYAFDELLKKSVYDYFVLYVTPNITVTKNICV